MGARPILPSPDMSMDHDEKQRMERIERALFGDGNNNGVLGRIGAIEVQLEHLNDTMKGIQATIARIGWIIIGAVLVAVVGLVLKSPDAPRSHNSTSVNVGAAEAAKLTSETSRRDYLTTADVAEREGVSESAVLDWIALGRFIPPPAKEGKAWTFAKTYRLTPATSGNIPEDPASSGIASYP